MNVGSDPSHCVSITPVVQSASDYMCFTKHEDIAVSKLKIAMPLLIIHQEARPAKCASNIHGNEET